MNPRQFIIASLCVIAPGFSGTGALANEEVGLPLEQPLLHSATPYLPPSGLALEGIQNHNRVRTAQAMRQTMRAEGELLRIRPYEWEAGYTYKNRQDKNANNLRSTDQEVLISTPIQTPGKQNLRSQEANQRDRLSDLTLFDAQHETAINLADLWLECQKNQSQVGLLTQLLAAQTQFEAQQQKRFKAGEIADLELRQSLNLGQQLSVELGRFQTLARLSLQALQVQFPGLMDTLQTKDCNAPTQTPKPFLDLNSDADTVQRWQQTIIAEYHPLLIQQTDFQIAQSQTQLASKNRVADPRVGLLMARDFSGAETVLGLQLSTPLSGNLRSRQLDLSQRRQGQSERLVSARQAEADLLAQQTWAQFFLSQGAAQQSQMAAQGQTEIAKRLQRAYQLGEGSHLELNVAQQQAVRSQLDALEQSYTALKARTFLLIHAHRLWSSE